MVSVPKSGGPEPETECQCRIFDLACMRHLTFTSRYPLAARMGCNLCKPSASAVSPRSTPRTQPPPRQRKMPFAHLFSRRRKTHALADGFPKNHLFVKNLQSGAEGQVQEWSNKRSHHLIAVKVMKRKEGEQPPELAILAELSENNFTLKYLGFFDQAPKPDECCILLEHCAIGDLHTFFFNHAKPRSNAVLSEAFMWSLFSQLANALAFLHEGRGCTGNAHAWRPLLHRDIKLENILVTSLGSKGDFSTIKIKLGDFGTAKHYDPRCTQGEQNIGTPCYWAPELTWEKQLQIPSSAKCSPATDVWATGAVVHYFAHGLLPHECPDVTRREWIKENPGTEPWRRNWFTTSEDLWWPGIAKRNVIPINLELRHQPTDRRRQRPVSKYTDALNNHLMMALRMDADSRPGAGQLAGDVESAHAAFLLDDLDKLQGNKAVERRDTAMDSSDDDACLESVRRRACSNGAKYLAD